MSERELIEQLVIEDPIFREAYEGFNDGCVFCGVPPAFDKPYEYAYHEPDCAWIAGARYLGRDLGGQMLKETAAVGRTSDLGF